MAIHRSGDVGGAGAGIDRETAIKVLIDWYVYTWHQTNVHKALVPHFYCPARQTLAVLLFDGCRMYMRRRLGITLLLALFVKPVLLGCLLLVSRAFVNRGFLSAGLRSLEHEMPFLRFSTRSTNEQPKPGNSGSWQKSGARALPRKTNQNHNQQRPLVAQPPTPTVAADGRAVGHVNCGRPAFLLKQS